MPHLTHLDSRGEASMVDVSLKPVVLREAVARGAIRLQRSTLALIQKDQIAKGNVLATARIAGIQAAKRTGELIPLCHPLPITHCEVRFEFPPSRDRIVITASARIAAQTGIEMEALTAVSVAALTIYDMCKAVDKSMAIDGVHLVSKTKRPLPIPSPAPSPALDASAPDSAPAPSPGSSLPAGRPARSARAGRARRSGFPRRGNPV